MRLSFFFLDLLTPIRQHLNTLFLTTFWDNDFLQSITTVEHILADFLDARREKNGGQLVAIGKRPLSDANDPFWYGNRLQA